MFKKLLLGIMLVGFLVGSVGAQTITENLETLNANLKQCNDLLIGLNVLSDTYKSAVSTNAKIQSLVDGGQFDQIPLNVKQALNQAWTALKNYIAVIEANPDIMEAFDF